ncbi:peroxiredoxin-like family protein [Flammeovirgaceae bacterium SG7u.111]|nr:peroxiredoxin-like family protein [Flammeovirgaceae bacterium SG7u.132]WPO37143.1 peroxiredoxin-like family protein [Flammeovirgaceae bacterium SG7u.111]
MKLLKSVTLLSAVILFNMSTLSAQIPDKAEDISPLLIGEVLPNSELTKADGSTAKFYDVIKEKPTVLVFYRGGWCPYCNMQLSALAIAEEEILELGYQIVAVSPDSFENIEPTVEKDKVKYSIYSDAGGKFSQEAGIAFKLSPEKARQKKTETLPVPTVFVTDTKGQILFEYISPNYKKRMTPELLMAVLKNLE